jgi:uncharacterized membrane protein YfcA
LETWVYILIGLAALVGGLVNALAGGGTLITFPALTFFGIPALNANITNTIALCPGYFGGTWAQRKDLKGQKKRLTLLIPAALIGGIGGGLLLLYTGDRLFRDIVPWLILIAAGLLAFQGLIKKWVSKQESAEQAGWKKNLKSFLLVGPATVYGGYFGAGLGVILLAVLGFSFKDNLTRLNALKQSLSLVTNVAAAVFFLFSDKVEWYIAAIMAAGALTGGYLGGKLAGRIKPEILRWAVVIIGTTVAIIMFIKN